MTSSPLLSWFRGHQPCFHQQEPESAFTVFMAVDCSLPLRITTLVFPLNDSTTELPSKQAETPFVYICQGGVSKWLSPAYIGPYHFQQRSSKSFTVGLSDCIDPVSVNRFKPHLGNSPPA